MSQDIQSIYDGVDYRYSHNDPDSSKALEIISRILGTAPSTDGLEYSLNLYAGGTGVNDRIAISGVVSPHQWESIYKHLRLRRPHAALNDEIWREDLEWLVCGHSPLDSPEAQSKLFIEKEKFAFQESATESSDIFFSDESNVNTWCVVWRIGNRLNYLSFDQG